jgi:hypothetical protein
LLFKEQFPWEFEKKITAVQRQMKAYWLIPLLTPIKSRWTVPVKRFLACHENVNFSWVCPIKKLGSAKIHVFLSSWIRILPMIIILVWCQVFKGLCYKTSNCKTPNYKTLNLTERRILQNVEIQNVESYRMSKYKTSTIQNVENDLA